MTFPITSLILENRELGLVIAVLIGVGFGFTLERAGFGQAPKLAAQFYLRDMRVFKVMFSAILTAMVGLMVFSGFGLADLTAISQSAVSFTYIWPMIVGGLLLGVGFIISGYCPGTSLVASASGNLDGVMTFVGVILGSVLFGEIYDASAAVQAFHVSGNKEFLFLYDLLGLPAPVLAAIVTVAALGMFLGAEQVERMMAKKRGEETDHDAQYRGQRKLAFSALGVVAVVGVATLALPGAPRAEEKAAVAPAKSGQSISQGPLARRVLDEPWTLRIIDIRDKAACEKASLPGASCVPQKELAKLNLRYSAGERDLVLVSDKGLDKAPKGAAHYPGDVFLLKGGYAGWKAYALTAPKPPEAGADQAAMEEYRFRAALNSVLTGVKPPPPPKPAGGVPIVAPRPKKKGGGGCG